MSAHAEAGFSLLELLCATAIVLMMSAMAIPQTLVGLDEVRAGAAARYLAGRLQWGRTYAAAHSSSVGFRFQEIEGRYCYSTYLDGNQDGIRTRDIDEGVDLPVKPTECLPDAVSGADLGLAEGVPLIGETTPDTSRNPVRLGRTTILAMSTTGTATPGTLYVRAGRRGQFALRTLGATGRVRVFEFDWRERRWVAR
ncbi:MAG TPA: prepilin-type N-terminal cleavage/methylation domain-containing protein [Vicinamibacterales bacterium]|nr:prepilin-type N-terminal cleavage/methylation domain-containing protein [Vicinamibacterales bacterium]